MINPITWGVFHDKDGLPHIVPMYQEGVPQPGHRTVIGCNCGSETKQYQNGQIITIHQIIH